MFFRTSLTLINLKKNMAVPFPIRHPIGETIFYIRFHCVLCLSYSFIFASFLYFHRPPLNTLRSADLVLIDERSPPNTVQDIVVQEIDEEDEDS
jgi:hypothetical protein